jgi:hypothetical protein
MSQEPFFAFWLAAGVIHQGQQKWEGQVWGILMAGGGSMTHMYQLNALTRYWGHLRILSHSINS